jgi:hypothetical protein
MRCLQRVSPPTKKNSYLASHHVLEKFGNFPFYFLPEHEGKEKKNNHNDDFFSVLSFTLVYLKNKKKKTDRRARRKLSLPIGRSAAQKSLMFEIPIDFLTVTERRRPNSTNPPPIHISFAFFLR